MPQGRNDYYSAFTVAELGELLPCVVFQDGFPCGFLAMKIDEAYAPGIFKRDYRKYKVTYEDLTSDNEEFGINDPKEADARARMLIYLIDNNFLII